jgi:hypothetical protein
VIDLHSHSTASDGEHSPEEVVARAAQAGIRTLAITDHDTVAGLAAARAAGDGRGVRVVPGIELSAFVHAREAHLLGHFVRPEDPRLATLAERLRVERDGRMALMVQKVCALGLPVRLEEVRALAGAAPLGRPHLARVMVEKGYVLSTREAFERYLGDRRPAWVDRFRLGCAEAIRLIRDAGGAATLAHPGASKMEWGDVQALARAGLAGLEVYHPDHNPSVRQKYLGLARDFRLVATAGSDFHGDKVAPKHPLGCVTMSEESLADLRARAPAPAS